MDNENIQICAVYVDGTARIYGPVQKDGFRSLIRSMKFNNYGKALQFAQEFEDKQRK